MRKKNNYMKILAAILSCVILGMALTACSLSRQSFDIKVHMPAGKETVSGYAYEQIMSKTGTVSVSVNGNMQDGAVTLISADDPSDIVGPSYVTPGMGAKFSVKKNTWYKVFAQTQGKGDSGFDYSVTVSGVTVRIE